MFTLSGWFPNWRKRALSTSWPMVQAIFHSGTVQAETVTGEGGQSEVFLTRILFTYSVDGTEFQGEYGEKFRSRVDAKHLLRSLSQGPLFVRYHPGAPCGLLYGPLSRRA
jgi:hypothetical protein